MAAGRKSPAGARLSPKRRKAGKPAHSSPDPEVRMDKVEKIKEAIERGKYNVPASEVAAKLLEEMRRR
ncbi:MAG TPA: flagellar biosynthesis anti-sigma factor FlgM [Acidobacteriaceae bacterium]|nr:flagellar biosynthesis anti-sigma factor FlgM [Acidobacteriaceae bacterium]